MPFRDACANSFTRVGPVGVTKQLWRTNLSSIRTEMITWREAVATHNRLYVRSKDVIAALDAGDGSILWNQSYDVTQIAAAGNDTLIALGNQKVLGLDGRTGDLRWEAEIPTPLFVPRLVTGDDIVLVATAAFSDPAARDASLFLFDARTGKRVDWNEGGRRRLWNQLSLWEYPSLITVGDSAVLCLTVRGPIVVRLETSEGTGGVPPTCFKGRYVHGFEDGGYYATIGAAATDAGELVQAWRKSGGDPEGWGRSRNVAISSSVYALAYFDDGGLLICFNPTTGEEHWRQEKGWPLLTMAVGAQVAVAAFKIPGKDGRSGGTEIQTISTKDGSVGARVQIPGVTVNTLLIAYRRVYVLGHYDPAVARPELSHASIPVAVCFGSD
jgi:outer membrane protein assembly factor BamB